MKTRLRRFAASWAAGVLLMCPIVAGGSPQPNVVFILADDLGWADLGCYGADLHETPNLDRLAREGVRFSQAYAMSVCSPSRAAFLTGKHAARLHLTTWREASLQAETDKPLLPAPSIADLPQAENTLAEALKQAGYLTFHVGKWHLGDAEHSPETQGFDLNIGGTHWGAPATYFHPFSGAFGSAREFRYVPGLGLGKPGDYLTDRLTDEALKLIDAAGDRPFFLNLWFHSPHTPVEGKPELTESFKSKLKPGFHHQNPGYAAMVHTLDANVGRVLKKLEDRGVSGNTLLVFASDNGGALFWNNRIPVTSNWPLRSGKGSLYEGGIRVPLIIRLPGVTVAGAVSDEPVICIDLLPTILEICSLQKAAQTLDGVSLVPLLKRPGSALGREALFFHYPHYYSTTTPVSAVRMGNWKLLEFFENQHIELYNLGDDPGEKLDLAKRQPERAAALRERLHDWWKTADALLPQPNPNFKGR